MLQLRPKGFQQKSAKGVRIAAHQAGLADPTGQGIAGIWNPALPDPDARRLQGVTPDRS